jgi:tRNA A-37 threonylcarbamoyl transferase component Bud32
MAFVRVSPAYRDVLARQGLASAEDFLHLAGVIYSGHPDRHVILVTLGDGPEALPVFLKKEHRVPWRDRLANAWAGSGLVSQSWREFQLLQTLRDAGIGCPEPLAVGEADGRAFLLLRAVEGSQDLRTFLHEHAGQPRLRRMVARQLGQAVARIHRAGFNHPDVFSKHVLAHWDHARGMAEFHFLDWQRSRCRRRLSWARRWRDLAALDATLASDLASAGDRLACLEAYLGSCGKAGGSLRRAVRGVRRHTAALLRRRRIRELRQPPLPAGAQDLVWLAGEALCVTREFRDALQGQTPPYLLLAESVRPLQDVHRARVPVPGSGWADLVRRSASRPWRWLWSRLRGRPLPSPELEQAATLFRLQRYGLTTPTLLAVGQQHVRPWRTESFLLTQAPEATVGLGDWLASQAGRRRWQVLRAAGEALRRMHEAGCYLDSSSAEDIAELFRVPSESSAPEGRQLLARGVSPWEGGPESGFSPEGAAEAGQGWGFCRPSGPENVSGAVASQGLTPLANDCRPSGAENQGRAGGQTSPLVILGSAAGIRKCHRPSEARAQADLSKIHACLGLLAGGTDALRFFFAYLGRRGWTPKARALARLLLRAPGPLGGLWYERYPLASPGPRRPPAAASPRLAAPGRCRLARAHHGGRPHG